MAGTMPHAIFIETDVDQSGLVAAYAAELPGCAVFAASADEAAGAMPARVSRFTAWLRAQGEEAPSFVGDNWYEVERAAATEGDGVRRRAAFTLDELPVMLAQCDAVVLAIPLSQRTRHLLNAATLAALPPHALVVNIGRGGLIDHAALVDALHAGRLGGAALDVTEPEPLPADSPLWQMGQVIITPHIGGLSPHYNDRAVALFAENLRRYAAGEALFNVVNRDAGY